MTAILGVSALYHDSAAALVVDGHIVAAAQEERFSRRKHDPRWPELAIDAVLAQGGLGFDAVDRVVFYDKPFLKFERLLESYIATAPTSFRSFARAMPVWLREKLFLKDYIVKRCRARHAAFDARHVRFTEHHVSHAASAFYPSPFEEALVLTLDGVGEWATTTAAIGRGSRLELLKQIDFPHSLGLLYSAFTYYTGFRVNSGEYKVMGLAPYGTPRFHDLILDTLVDLKPDGSFRLDQRYFDYAGGLKMTNKRFAALFGEPVRRPDTDPLTPFHMDVAASVQVVTETIVKRLVGSLVEETGIGRVCLAGGVALNCVANGRLVRDGVVDELWVQPASGDAGGALGAALTVWYEEYAGERRVEAGDAMRGGYLGPAWRDADIAASLDAAGAVHERLAPDEMIDAAARDLADGRAIGWFQGRMEFGPRALGGRSILADPRSPETQKALNLKVKFRESFRPFAPSVLASEADRWFALGVPSPYMLLVGDVADEHRLAETAEDAARFGIDRLNVPRSTIPAVTHVDGSARVQTVDGEHNPEYHALLTRFHELTGCPVLVNTSFNVRGEPIVGSPADAFRCLMGTDLDALYVGRHRVRKAAQDPALAIDYRGEHAAD